MPVRKSGNEHVFVCDAPYYQAENEKHPASYRLRKKPQKQLELNGKERQVERQ